MTVRLVAILDSPTRDTMAMRGLILRDDDAYFTSGLTSSRRISPMEFTELVAGGHVLEVEGELPHDLLHSDIAGASAFWVGTRFDEEASSLHVPGPLGPRVGAIHTDSGRFWIDLAQPVFLTAQHWLNNALRVSLRSASTNVTRLMTRVDSTSDCTRAAVVRQSSNPSRDVDRFLRRDHDYGLQASERSLRSRLTELTSQAERDPVPVLAIVAGALEGSYAWAMQFAEDLGTQMNMSVGFSAFRGYFGVEAIRLYGDSRRRSTMNAGTLITDWRAPEAIAEQAVLRPLRHDSPSLPPAVIDGFRHAHIVDALRRIDQVTLRVGIYDAPGLPGELDGSASIDEVLSDPTEQEISALASQADYRLPQEDADARAGFVG